MQIARPLRELLGWTDEDNNNKEEEEGGVIKKFTAKLRGLLHP